MYYGTPAAVCQLWAFLSCYRLLVRINRLLTFDFLHFEGLDDIAKLDVVERTEVDTRFVAFLDGVDIVLEATQRGDFEIIDGGDAVAQNTALRTALDFGPAP